MEGKLAIGCPNSYFLMLAMTFLHDGALLSYEDDHEYD
jgi:hypothetical protein